MYIYTCVEDGGRRVTSGFLSLCGFSSPFLTIGCKHSTRGVHVVCVCVCIYILVWRMGGGGWLLVFFLSVAFPHLPLLLGVNTLQEVCTWISRTCCLTIIYCFLCSTVPSHGVHDGSKPDGKESVYLYLLTWKWGKAFSYLFSTLVFALHG